jgi:hypothetical protein
VFQNELQTRPFGQHSKPLHDRASDHATHYAAGSVLGREGQGAVSFPPCCSGNDRLPSGGRFLCPSLQRNKRDSDPSR